MAKKARTVFFCTSCGQEEGRWLGRCPGCGEWNTFKEMTIQDQSGTKNATGIIRQSAAKGKTNGSQRKSINSHEGSNQQPVLLGEAKGLEQLRFISGIGELDRVLGGGIMAGSSVLIGGEPGIGKSTLLLQAGAGYLKNHRVLYISGEEGAEHIKHRADRLGLQADTMQVLTSPELERIMDALQTIQPEIVIIDSIQTLITQLLDSAPGTVNQMKLSVYGIAEWARNQGAGVFFIAHVTKEGEIAGPKTIEHMVDAVALFEHSGSEVRFLRCSKNRFGSVDEVGLFRMDADGLEELSDPSQVFLVHRDQPMPPGVIAAPTFEGSRILMVEIQALTIPSQAGFGRVYSDRIDARRVSRVCAVLEKHGGIRLHDQDVYVNVAGGMKITEVGAELPLALAILSAVTGKSMNRKLAVAGELSLSGELRPVSHLKQRFQAARELGFSYQIGPASKSASWTQVNTIREAIRQALEWAEGS
jgi:DNA repair protein RadA/Sms